MNIKIGDTLTIESLLSDTFKQNQELKKRVRKTAATIWRTRRHILYLERMVVMDTNNLNSRVD